MAASRFSIRHRLLWLGALATASIWAGALLQYVQLRDRSAELAAVRGDLARADRFAQAARLAARERGLGNGWLFDPRRTDPSELAPARRDADALFASLAVEGAGLPAAVGAWLGDLTRVRGLVDRREIAPAEAFAFHTALVTAMQDAAAQRLAASMIAVGLPYEHVNHLQRLVEGTAQMRGLTTGALRAGSLAPGAAAALARELLVYEETDRLYQRSAPADAARRIAPALESPALKETLDTVRALVATRPLDPRSADAAAAWWTRATEAVDTLATAAGAESAGIEDQAERHLAALERQMRWTVAALVVLGILTLAMVLSTVGRIVSGLNRLLDGLDAVGRRRDFAARIDDSGHDEFGAISGSINKLIAIAGSVVEEQETLSQTDPLTGAVNRRGFDLQLEARTTAARTHAPPLCLVMIDVDHFKAVNDDLGHLRGDLVLKGFANVLRGAVRPDDLVARYGGEEFVVLLPACALDAATLVADKLRAAVEAHDFGIDRRVTASFGVAEWRRGQTATALLAEADARLYAAKAAGRNRVRPGAIAATAA